MLPWQVDKMVDVRSSASSANDICSLSPYTEVFVPEQPNPEVITHLYCVNITVSNYIVPLCVYLCVCVSALHVCVCTCVYLCLCVYTYICMYIIEIRPLAFYEIEKNVITLCTHYISKPLTLLLALVLTSMMIVFHCS